ncbi:MAG: hypothetical protein HY901_09355 [Deltaproteobacteria bacterium]|nr:hypothetical protein [Deltaproteobacteria bacterium]
MNAQPLFSMAATCCLALALVVAAGCHTTAPSTIACRQDSDCAEATPSCREGRCQVVPCETSADCEADEACADRQCHSTSCPSGPCASGQVCIARTCVEIACVGVACADDEICLRGTCYLEDCPSLTCGPDKVCIDDACEEKTCLDAACTADEACLHGTCYPKDCSATPCEADQVCVGETCIQKTCVGVGCSETEFCLDGTCVEMSCTDGMMNGDESDQDCGGSCPGCLQEQGCFGTSDCADGLECLGGFCQADCDTQRDPRNCGRCGKVCPTPLHAAAICSRGVCGRGPCETGWFDFDATVTLGCETRCVNRVCTRPDGTTITLTNDPLPETGLVFQSPASGSSLGDELQTSTSVSNVGVLGEPTPGGTVQQTSTALKNRVGLMASDPP